MRASIVALSLLFVACGGEAVTPDAGRGLDASQPDGGRDAVDAGSTLDAGAAGEDAGADDAGAEDAGAEDAAVSDAGPTDSGAPRDAGPTDAGVDACVPPPCPAPPRGCRYVGATLCTCGTLVCDCGMGAPCAPSEYCDYAADRVCGGSGTCQPRPTICPRILRPVCGCDGVDYDNECLAQSGGTDVASDGRCASTSDCRASGCPSGESCMECRGPGGGVWVCLPAGTAC